MPNLTSNPGQNVTLKATAALTKNRFIGFDGAMCVANAKAIGAVERAYDNAEDAKILISGVVLIEAGGTIAVGDPVTAGGTGADLGRAVATTLIDLAGTGTPVTAGAADAVFSGGHLPQHINGYALTAGEEGDTIQVLLA